MELNVLAQNENLFIMDNHRAFLWCVGQLVNEKLRYDYLHIDAHYDALPGALKEFNEINRRLSSLTLKDFLEMKNSYRKPLIRFDNYHSVFFDHYKNNLNEIFHATHKIGIPITEGTPLEIHALLDFLRLRDTNKSLILNLDLDYLVTKGSPKIELVSEEFFSELKDHLHEILNNKKNIVTIALSPECSGGWDMALKLLQKVLK